MYIFDSECLIRTLFWFQSTKKKLFKGEKFRFRIIHTYYENSVLLIVNKSLHLVYFNHLRNVSYLHPFSIYVTISDDFLLIINKSWPQQSTLQGVFDYCQCSNAFWYIFFCNTLAGACIMYPQTLLEQSVFSSFLTSWVGLHTSMHMFFSSGSFSSWWFLTPA